MKSSLSRFVVGVDESGTGAFAGPFTVTAFMTYAEDTEALLAAGATDSKKLTAEQRFRIREELAYSCFVAETIVVAPTYHEGEQRRLWREAAAQAIRHCFQARAWNTEGITIYIDGMPDPPLTSYLERLWSVYPEYIIRGDEKIPQVGAASILAKTRRTELMRLEHERFPMYGFAKHDGYGTKAHLEAIEEHGICELHRRVAPLLRYFEPTHGKATAAPRPLRK